MNSLQFVNHEYHSVPQSPSWLKHHFPLLHLYPKILTILGRDSLNARQGQYDGRKMKESAFRVIRALEQCGADFHISGIQHLAGVKGACVVIANHMSTLESVTLPGIIQPLKPVTFIIKRSLLAYPIYRHVLRSYDPVVVDRMNPRKDLKVVLEEGCKRLQQGISVLVFPQGTRTAIFDPARFNTIGIKLAKRAGVSVLPLALHTDLRGHGKVIKEFGTFNPGKAVYYQFGEPLEIQGRGHAEHESVVAFIRECLAEWQAE